MGEGQRGSGRERQVQGWRAPTELCQCRRCTREGIVKSQREPAFGSAWGPGGGDLTACEPGSGMIWFDWCCLWEMTLAGVGDCGIVRGARG